MKVSVVVPAWKAEDYLEECLDSIRRQTYFRKNPKDYEIVVCVDGCKTTLQEIERIRNRYEPEMKIYYSEKNVGTYITLNTAIEKAVGEIIVIFGADDFMNETMIEKILENYGNNDIVRFKYDNYQNGVNKGTIRFFSYGAISFKKYVWKEINGFADWRVAGDKEFVVRAEKIFKQKLIDESFFRRTIHSENMTRCKEYGMKSAYRQEKIQEIKRLESTKETRRKKMSTVPVKKLRKLKIKVSVGMPLYQMSDVAEVAFEGLENQKTSLAWELIVLQEKKGAYDWKKHKEGLKKAGCQNVREIMFDKKTTIGNKALILSKEAKGSVIVIQDGDDRPHSKRIDESYKNIIDRKNDFYHEKHGYFYNLITEQTILFIHNEKKHVTGLNKAYSAKLFKKLPSSFANISKHIDRNLFGTLKPKKIFQNVELYEDGFFTDGKNKISKRLKYYDEPTPPFYATEFKVVLNKNCEVTKYNHRLKESYFLNLEDEIYKLRLLKGEMNKVSINPERIVPVSFNDRRLREQIEKIVQSKVYFDGIKKAKEMSQRLTVADILKNAKNDIVAIFEDDIYFKYNANEVLKKVIDELPEKFGVCYLGCYARDGIEVEEYSEHLLKVTGERPRIWGGHAIIYHRSIFKELSEKLESFESDILDFEISKSIVTKHDCYIANPMFCFQSKEALTVAKQPMHGKNFDFDYLEKQSFECIDKALHKKENRVL